jgi:uncharacterized membrane protein
MINARSSVPAVVTALVSAGLVDASRRDDAQRVVMRVLGAPEKTRVSSRALLVEIAAYVGGALVVASIGLFLAQYWADFSEAVQVIVLATIAVLLAVAGFAVSRVGSGYRELRAGRDEVRRRLASALLIAAAAAAGIAVGRLVDLQLSANVGNGSWPSVAGAVTALALAAAAYAYAPSVLGQLAMMGAVFVLVTGAWSLLDEGQTDTLGPGLVFMAVGFVWLVGAEGGLFREVLEARAIGSAMTLFGAQFTLFSRDHDNLSYLLILLVALAAFVMYLRVVSWPYLVVGVLGITLVVPEAVIDWSAGSLGPAGAVLVAGVTLLGASLAGFRVRKGVAEEQEEP